MSPPPALLQLEEEPIIYVPISYFVLAQGQNLTLLKIIFKFF